MEQKPKKYFLIPLIIGICLFVVGLILIIKAIVTNVPPMSDSGWFDAETANSARLFAGIPICFFGVVIGVGVAIIVYHCDPVVKKRNAEKLAEHQKRIADSFGGFVKGFSNENNESQTKTCAYCGSIFPKNKNECPNCGAKQTKK